MAPGTDKGASPVGAAESVIAEPITEPVNGGRPVGTSVIAVPFTMAVDGRGDRSAVTIDPVRVIEEAVP